MPEPAQQIIDTLARCKRVLLTTHVRPDGDALGSTAAMVMGLTQKGIESQVLLLSHLPGKYGFVFEENQISFIDVESGWPGESGLGSRGSGFGSEAESSSTRNPKPETRNPFFDEFDAL